MKILLALTSFKNMTGSEIYTYELARVLSSRGHDVSIMANEVGGIMVEKLKKNAPDVRITRFFEDDESYDIINSAQPAPTNYCLAKYQNTPIVQTCHSHLSYERPLIDEGIKHYIAIRPEISTHLVDNYGISVDKCSVIYNGVDTTRFNTKDIPPNMKEDGSILIPTLLFVGTNDHLRAQVVEELKLRAKKNGLQLRLVGQGFPEEPRWDIETITKECDTTASIYLGRTTIEGWMCGKGGWIYEVDDKGNILDIKYAEVPDQETLKHFDIEYMTDEVLKVYQNIVSYRQLNKN